MKRSAILRRSPLQPGKRLATRVRLRQVNHKRLKKRRATQFGPQAAWCRRAPCCGCGWIPGKVDNDPSHVKTRGAGGLDRDTVPMCRKCHDRMGQIGVLSWQREVGVSLAAVLLVLRRRFYPDD